MLEVGLEEALVGVLGAGAEDDVAEEPVVRRVPGVAQLPVVAGGGVAAPAARGGAELPLVGVLELAQVVEGDAVDERADAVAGGGAVHHHLGALGITEGHTAAAHLGGGLRGLRHGGRDDLGEAHLVQLHPVGAHLLVRAQDELREGLLLRVELLHGDEHLRPLAVMRGDVRVRQPDAGEERLALGVQPHLEEVTEARGRAVAQRQPAVLHRQALLVQHPAAQVGQAQLRRSGPLQLALGPAEVLPARLQAVVVGQLPGLDDGPDGARPLLGLPRHDGARGGRHATGSGEAPLVHLHPVIAHLLVGAEDEAGERHLLRVELLEGDEELRPLAVVVRHMARVHAHAGEERLALGVQPHLEEVAEAGGGAVAQREPAELALDAGLGQHPPAQVGHAQLRGSGALQVALGPALVLPAGLEGAGEGHLGECGDVIDGGTRGLRGGGLRDGALARADKGGARVHADQQGRVSPPAAACPSRCAAGAGSAHHSPSTSLRGTMRAGMPTATLSGGTSLSTTALAPIRERAPMVMGPRMRAPAPTHTSSSMTG